MMEKPDFLHFDTNSWKLKVDQKILELGVVKNGCGHSGLVTLKLGVSQEGIN